MLMSLITSSLRVQDGDDDVRCAMVAPDGRWRGGEDGAWPYARRPVHHEPVATGVQAARRSYR
jgi:hypothetical protein